MTKLYSEVPNKLSKIEVTLGDMLANSEIVIDGVTYLWVDGYKGVNENMQGYGNYQYELGEPYLYEKTPAMCSRGYHFCVNLEDVFEFYKFDFSNRYFKVRALVNKEEYLSYGQEEEVRFYASYKCPSPPPRYIQTYQGVRAINGQDEYGPYYYRKIKIDKLAAKVIILTEEITKKDYFDYIPFIDILSNYWIESKDELISIKDFSLDGMRAYLDSKFITKAYNYYSPEFMKLYLQHYGNWDSISVRAEKLSHIIKVIETCRANGLTKDTTAMIIMDEKL